jgi:hypothetical protein
VKEGGLELEESSKENLLLLMFDSCLMFALCLMFNFDLNYFCSIVLFSLEALKLIAL